MNTSRPSLNTQLNTQLVTAHADTTILNPVYTLQDFNKRVPTVCVHRLWQPFFQPEVFSNADQWLYTTFGPSCTSSSAAWHYGGGSYVNGITYPSHVYFEDAQDFLVFKLKFSELF